EVYRSWRAVADSYDPPRVLVGEIWLPDVQRFAAYLRPDEMHTAFNFDFMSRPWDAAELRSSIDTTLAAHSVVGAPATWVLSNHDVTRPVTRYGRQDSGFAFLAKRFGTPTDLDLGTRRARAACLLTAALPGCLYIYQGDELGLPEDEELPLDVIQDPMHFRSGGIDPGRDGCRVPLPWTAQPDAEFGFSAPTRLAAGDDAQDQPGVVLVAARSWLPQPQWWGDYAVDRQGADPASMLSLYRRALELRRASTALRQGAFSWWDLGPDVLAFTRDDVACVVNLGRHPLRLPESAGILLASAPTPSDRRLLDADTAVWLRLPANDHLSAHQPLTAPGQDHPERNRQ
ncbi:MAG: alpha-amylase family glycosyl hydrolase, partial [Propionicimonas sp.]|nr:alpha-amylase family glycosyl hydrolase [Propionicimonas sp.]